jgi:hypothetical protein
MPRGLAVSAERKGARWIRAPAAKTANRDPPVGSRAEIDGLAAKTITVRLSGGSVALVQASDSVSGSASGGSNLTVQGDAQVDVESSGGSTVTGG